MIIDATNHSPRTIDVPLFIPKTVMSRGWPFDVPALSSGSLAILFAKEVMIYGKIAIMRNSVGHGEGMELTSKKLLISNQSDLRLFCPEL